MTLRVQDYLVLYKCDKRRENRLYMGGPLNILNIGPIGLYYSKEHTFLRFHIFPASTGIRSSVPWRREQTSKPIRPRRPTTTKYLWWSIIIGVK